MASIVIWLEDKIEPYDQLNVSRELEDTLGDLGVAVEQIEFV